MKQAKTEKSLQEAASAAIQDLLGCLPDAQIVPSTEIAQLDHDHQVDALFRVDHGGDTRLLVVEVKAQGAPRFIRSAVYRLESCLAHMHQYVERHHAGQLVPMLVSPYLSPESQAICRDRDVAYLDFEGNARVAFGSVYIERSVSKKPKTELRALRSIFTPKAAAILRALLREPNRHWRVTDLAASANASLGHVSNVCKALLEREWIRKGNDGLVLTRPNALVQTWRENHRRPRGHQIHAYTHLHGSRFNELASTALSADIGEPRAVYSLGSAAQWIAPFSRGATQSFYADDAGAERLRETLKLEPVGRGSNVVLNVTTDESLFDDAIEPLPNHLCTSPIVTYLDLWCGNDREREAAAYLAKEALPWIR